MPSPFPKANSGVEIKKEISGFPMFIDAFKPRVITSDPWAFLEYQVATNLPKSEQAEHMAFIEQAYDFYEAAENPQLGSKPMLYYYSFLNLVKVALKLKGVTVPPAAKHGISDPRVNIRERFRLEGQKLHITGRAHDRSEIIPEFIHTFGGKITGPQNIKLVNLLGQVPSIHRIFTYSKIDKTQFVPIKRIVLLQKDHKIWSRIIFNKKDEDVTVPLKILKKHKCFKNVFSQVTSEKSTEIWYETTPIQGRKRALLTAIVKTAKLIRSVQLSTILTQYGYQYYFCTVDSKYFLPPLAAWLATMFYFGSITRYKPADFDKIRAGKYGWISEELINILPTQFLYTLCSEVSGVDVVKPHAVII